MKTVVTDSPEEAAEFIQNGAIVAFPTETVYGLGADVFNESAVGKIFEAKQRPADNPLIVHIADPAQIGIVAFPIMQSAKKLVDRFFPGPLSVVLNKRPEVPLIATAGLETVGIRMPKSETAHAFLLACNTPVVAPSANLSGRPSPTTWKAVREDLDGRIDCILAGNATEIGLESTVVDCSRETPVLLRPGAVSIDELRDVVPDIITTQLETEVARSPGMRHRHYSPRARIRLVHLSDTIDGARRSAYIGVHDRSESFAIKRVCLNANAYARELFEFFRECDRQAIGTIYCEIIPAEGIGSALMDRLRRASER